jgi:eukaryotic-like serine/threonine-protein kinase
MALAIGSQLAGYHIVALLGRGGMGEVYRATDSRLGRDVALKVLPQQQTASPEQKERFTREARAASALNHPNIITIYEIGSDRGIDFIAMELIRGRTLTDVLSDHRTTFAELMSYALQVAEGLSRAHGAGIVHRDLTPTNIMVTDDRLI